MTFLSVELQRYLTQWWSAAPLWLCQLTLIVVAILGILAWIALVAIVAVYLERRLAGFMQSRLGPNRVGPEGVLQPLADGIKLFIKEAILPDDADPWLFRLAPVLVFLGAMLPFVALPFGAVFIIADLDVGLFFILSFAALEVIGILMAGWAANSKWSLYGGMRLAAQMMSYELPMGLCAMTAALMAGSLSTERICEAQGFWPWQWMCLRGGPFTLVAALIFYIASLANTKRAPYDLPEAESELVSGFHTEYSSMPFAFFFMAEYAAMYVVSALTAVLFLGGYKFPVPVPDAWAQSLHTLAFTHDTWLKAVMAACIEFFNVGLKAWILLIVMIWLRWTLPRIRLDQVMYGCLKVMLPFSLVCVMGTAVMAVLDYQRMTIPGRAMGFYIAWVLAFAAFIGFVCWLWRLSASDPRKRPPIEETPE
ncbi:MAG: NADH-quinone oxidoreductase subunit H [Candidatus Sumerlaeota bacterium]|nr:NADH-quinone oxidoreductase subunit H [Candidatus Sumerlaeota bacterium]